MKAMITAKFEIDVSDWNTDENLSVKENKEKIIEDLSDYSVFMPMCDYKKLKSVEVVLK